MENTVLTGAVRNNQGHVMQSAVMSAVFQGHRTVVQFMWQADLYEVAKFLTDCLGVYNDTDPRGVRASDLP